MPIRQSVPYWTGKLSFSRVEQLLQNESLEAVMDLEVSNPHILTYGNCSQTLPF
jgi:hypothetical protein